MKYQKCLRCRLKADCSILAAIKDVVAGHGSIISSVRPRCGAPYKEGFDTGQRVKIAYSGNNMRQKVQFLSGYEGTVLSWSQTGKVNVLLDAEDDCDPKGPLYFEGSYGDEIAFCRLQSFWSDEVTPLDEPKRKTCECGAVAGKDGRFDVWRGLNGEHGFCDVGGGEFCQFNRDSAT